MHSLSTSRIELCFCCDTYCTPANTVHFNCGLKKAYFLTTMNLSLGRKFHSISDSVLQSNLFKQKLIVRKYLICLQLLYLVHHSKEKKVLVFRVQIFIKETWCNFSRFKSNQIFHSCYCNAQSDFKFYAIFVLST